MQNIQDLQGKIFFESKTIIDILGEINNVEELVSKHDLINDLAEKTSFLKLLNKNLEHYQNEKSGFSDNSLIAEDLVTEEEAIFNNELNEIGENFESTDTEIPVIEQEEIFNHQIEEIIESDFHESMVNLAEEQQPEANVNFISDEITDHLELEEEAVFNNQLNEIDEEPETEDQVLSFVDEERILEDSQPEDDQFDEEIFQQNSTEEEIIYENQLQEISEEEGLEENTHQEITPDLFEIESNEDDILIEETENEWISSDFNRNQEELITENSNVESILTEIKNQPEVQEEEENSDVQEDSERRKIVDIDKPQNETGFDGLKSDQNFENIEAYKQEKKIKLANIRGLRTIQTLFDDDHLEVETPEVKQPETPEKEDSGSLVKNNVPTDFMEAEKKRPEFKLDLNDRIAFSKVLFGGSQSDLNNAITELNNCRNLEDAKEYLSDLYYDKKWEKVDDYAQRLWILVENKFA